MRPLLPAFLARLLAIALSVALCGCTVIGLGMDVAHRDPRGAQGAALASLERVKPGSHLVVTLTDRSTVEGDLAGLATAPSTGWRARDAALRDSLASWRALPALGDTVRLAQSALFLGAVEFEGLSARGITVRGAGRLDSRVVGWSDFTELRSGAGSWSAAELRALVRDPEVPLESRIRLVRDARAVELAPADVASWVLTRPRSRGPRWVFLGLVVDVLVLVLINQTFIYSG